MLVRQWSQWFQVGLLAWQQEQQRSGERQFSNAPVWNFIVPPMPHAAAFCPPADTTLRPE
jgi:type VI secretion system protein ImpM